MTPEALARTHLSAFGPDKAWSGGTFATLLADTAVILTGDANSFVLGRVTLDEAEILTLATDPDQQRKGLAAKALSDFADQAAQAGALSVFLEVAEDNTAALALYTKAGFAQVGARKAYYRRANGPAVRALILRRDID